MDQNQIYFYILQDCNCADGYTKNSSDVCEQVNNISPTISHSDYCLAPSNRIEYSSIKTRIYKSGFSNSSIGLLNAPSSDVQFEIAVAPQWKSDGSSTGPMNRAGVWVDSDCDGDKDSLVTNQKLTIAFNYNNTGNPRTIYIGMGSDNQFELKVNNQPVASTQDATNGNNFYIWHVFPVTLVSGWNYFNAIGIGDGSINDALGITIYDNTAAQLAAATNDSQLTILFTSSSLLGQHIDVATCPTGYNLDTSLGQGSYNCVQRLTADCI